MTETNADPSKDNPQKAPEVTDPGKADTKPPVTPQDDLPEKFKGKTAAEIAKAHLELERKLGEDSENKKKLTDELASWKALGTVIRDNPSLKAAVQAEIDRISGKKSDPSDQNPDKPKEPDDTRIALENQIVDKIEEKFGLAQLAPEKKREIEKRIGIELCDMYDPGGRKSPSDVLRMIPLDKLPKAIEKAYRLATLDDEVERARSEAYIEARTNSEASFGSMASTGINTKTRVLTAGQKEVARKMNISEEDYIKQLDEIEKE